MYTDFYGFFPVSWEKTLEWKRLKKDEKEKNLEGKRVGHVP